MHLALEQIGPIVTPLKQIRRRARVLAVVTGAAQVAWMGLGAFLFGGLMDYLFHLPGPFRLMVLVVVTAWLGILVYRKVVRPAWAKVPLDAVAARLEKAHPGYADRLRSSLAFAGGGVPGSLTMQEVVVRQAADAAGGIKVNQAVDARPLQRALTMLLPMAAILTAVVLVWPVHFRLGLERLTLPWTNAVWPREVEMLLVKGVPSELPLGQRLEVAVKLNRGDRADRQVMVSWQVAGEAVQRQLLQRSAEGIWAAGIEVRTPERAVLPKMKVWIEAKDDQIGPLTVALIPRLQATKVMLHVEPPAYCRVPASDIDLRTQAANVPLGSKLRLELGFNRKVKDVAVDVLGEGDGKKAEKLEFARPGGAAGQEGEATAVGQWRAEKSMRFRVRGVDENGFSNAAAEEYELIVRPDQLPVIQLRAPLRSEDRTADAVVPLEALLEDDYGIAAMWMEARLLAAEAPTTQPTTGPAGGVATMDLLSGETAARSGVAVSQSGGEAGRRRLKVTYPWKLTEFPSALLKPGDVIEFQAAVRDTFELDGQQHDAVRTPMLRISIISQEQLLQRVYDDLRQVASQLTELKGRQDRLRSDTDELRDGVTQRKAFDAGDEAVAARIADQQTRAAAQAKEASGRLNAIEKRMRENASPNKELQEAINQTQKLVQDAADEQMMPAAADAKSAGENRQAQASRAEKLAQASKRQGEASEQLHKAIAKLGDLGGLQRAVDIIQDLLTRQRQVTRATGELSRTTAGKRSNELSPEEKERQKSLAERQGDLSRQTKEAIEQLKAMAQRQEQADQASSQAMKNAAEKGESQSVSQHQQSAQGAIQGNQSSQASSSQQSAESGLEQMLDGLKDAQQRKLEELIKKLASLQEQLKNLIHRQAGHNLDNLGLRAVNDEALIKALTEKAARSGEARAPGDAGQLMASQQQSHRNSADLGLEVDKLPGAAEVAQHLNKATSRMERAVGLLKAGQLADAFAPPQTEALGELELALAEVDAMKKKAEQETRDKKQEQLRKLYEEVRTQQVQVGAVTKTLDKVLAEQKRRADLVRLAQLAVDQKKLGERVDELGKELGEFGSEIFNATNSAIAGDMTSVSTQLAAQKTGKPTQFRQVQIVAKLDAIIRALTPPKMDPSKYAEKSGDGGGGGGGSKRRLPPAAELRLIRDLQQLVNAGTALVGKDDKDLLPDLAGQQGAVRGTFDDLVAKAAKIELPDEKASRELVPEETEDAAKTQQEAFDQQLLTEKPVDESGKGDMPDVKMIARRMTRSNVRLGEQADAGAITQTVQKKIVEALDRLIEEASKQQQQASSSSQGQSQQAKADPNAQGKPTDQQGKTGQSSSSTPAGESKVTPGGTPPSPTGDIRETAKEWGGISQRDRQAIIESAGENIVEKYRELTEEYYRALSVKATEER